MKLGISTQTILTLVILLGGGLFLGGEYLIVTLYPTYKQEEIARLSELEPYENEDLHIKMGISRALYGEVEPIAGGLRIRRPRFWGVGPSITISSRPNPERNSKFLPTLLAKWQTRGIYEQIPRYRFWHTNIHARDAVLIRLFRGRSMHLTGRIISSERLVEVDCTPGQEDETLYLQFCEDTIRSVKIIDSESIAADDDPIMELMPRTATSQVP